MTYIAIVDVENPGLKLRPGMTVNVSIVTSEARGILKVPNSALRFTPPQLPAETSQLIAEMRQQTANENTIVWVMDERCQLKPYSIRTGLADKTYSAVVSGDLKEGQKIVIGKESAVSTTNNPSPGPPIDVPPPPPIIH